MEKQWEEQEKKLRVLWVRGQNRAEREELMEALEGICSSLAALAARRESLEYEDLLQQAYLAAIEALRQFDPRRHRSISSHLSGCVRRELSEYCAANRQVKSLPMRLPRSTWRQLGALREARERLRLSGEPFSDQQLAQEAGVSERQLRHLLVIESMQAGSSEPVEIRDPFAVVAAREETSDLIGALSRLSQAQRRNLSSRRPGRRRRALAALSADRSLRSGRLLLAWPALTAIMGGVL